MKLAHLLTGLALALLFAVPIAADEAGQQLFVDACSGCHQLGGIGQPGLAPPLVDPDLWAGLGDKAPQYLVGVMFGGLTGKISAMGQDYVGVAMPPQDWLNNEEMQAVATYVLQDLNHLDMTPPLDMIAATRNARPTHQALRAVRKEALQ